MDLFDFCALLGFEIHNTDILVARGDEIVLVMSKAAAMNIAIVVIYREY